MPDIIGSLKEQTFHIALGAFMVFVSIVCTSEGSNEYIVVS